jgi:uncharacterized protein involved in exopolysaccharide biosynthesis
MLTGTGAVSKSMRDLASVLFRRKFQIAVTFVAVSVLAAAATWVRADVYNAEAKLLIRLGRENLSVDPSVSGPTVNPNGNRENEINSELAILRSRPLAEQLVDALGPSALLNTGTLGSGGPASEVPFVKRTLRTAKSGVGKLLKSADMLPTLSSRDKAVNRVMSSFSARVEKRSNIISANFEADNPELAQTALENLVQFYLDRHIQVFSAQAPQSFFETQAEAFHGELARREQALESFRSQYGITNMDRQKEVMLERINAIRTQLGDTGAQLSQTRARIASLEKSLVARPSRHELSRTTGRTNYAADSLKERLAELRLEETDMAGRYPAQHRPLVQLRQQIAQIEGALSQEQETLTEVTTGVDANHEQLQLALENEQAQSKAQEASLAVLGDELKSQEDALAALSGRELELNRLLRDVELAEKDYRQYRENVQRAKISSAMDLDKVSNVSVVQPAVSLPNPVRPKRLRDTLLGMAAGAFLGVFLAFAREYLDDSISAKEHVEKRLGIPVLAVIKEKAFKACP